MRALLARSLRTLFGMILAVGIVALPQASWAQVQHVSGHPVGVKVLALSGGFGFEAASLAGWSLQRVHVWLRLLDPTVMSGAVSAPPAIKPRRLQVMDQITVR